MPPTLGRSRVFSSRPALLERTGGGDVARPFPRLAARGRGGAGPRETTRMHDPRPSPSGPGSIVWPPRTAIRPAQSPGSPGSGILRARHGLPTTGDGVYFLIPSSPQVEGETTLRHLLSVLEPLVLPGVSIALTPRRPGCSEIADQLAGLLARSRIDARAWIAPHVRGGSGGQAALSASARALVRGARVLVLDEGGTDSTGRLLACRSLLLAAGVAEVLLLALDRPA